MMKETNRFIRSLPHRSSIETWDEIVNILCEHDSESRTEMERVSGIASMIISARLCLNSPIVVECKGPRIQIFCLYDDDAIDGSDANENSFYFNPLSENWLLSLPCHKDDLEGYNKLLKERSSRIRLRDSNLNFQVLNSNSSYIDMSNTNIDTQRFLNQ